MCHPGVVQQAEGLRQGPPADGGGVGLGQDHQERLHGRSFLRRLRVDEISSLWLVTQQLNSLSCLQFLSMGTWFSLWASGVFPRNEVELQPLSVFLQGISCCARRRASTTTFPSQRKMMGMKSSERNLR